MKRLPELQMISMDHHQGLVFARRVKKAAASDDTDKIRDMWTNVETSYETELEPHFQIEERYIAPILEKHGEGKLVKQLDEEHKAIRRMFMPESRRTSDDLNTFAILLEKHIRFEEREFLEVAQKHLNPDELQAVAEACIAVREQV
jgi:hemerythrin-like domain-containing protein